MNNKNYLVLQKSEWNRINNQAHPPVVVPHETIKDGELKALAEQSQKWIKSWPDTDEGHVKLFLKRKEQRQLQEVAAVKLCERKKENRDKRITNEAITRARQMIFEDGCYGRELISALLESKMLEEREAQTKLQAEVKQKALELEKQLEAKATRYIDFDNEHAEIERRRKERTVECAKINMNTHRCQKIQETQSKELEKEIQIEDAILMKKLLDYEKAEEKKCQAIAIQALKDQEEDQKRVKEFRAKREQVDADIAEVWRGYQARRRRKEMLVLDEIHKDRHNQESSKKNYELVQKLKDESDKRYDDFVNKGIERSAEIEKTKLLEEAATTITNHSNRRKLAKYRLSQCQVPPVPTDRNKLFCLKQSIFTKKDRKTNEGGKSCKNQAQLTFLSTPTTLRDQLKERSKEPSPWNGTRGAHIKFAVNARGMLGECKHGNVVRKVVDAYRKSNHLNKHTLPVFDDEIQPFIEATKF